MKSLLTKGATTLNYSQCLERGGGSKRGADKDISHMSDCAPPAPSHKPPLSIEYNSLRFPMPCKARFVCWFVAFYRRLLFMCSHFFYRPTCHTLLHSLALSLPLPLEVYLAATFCYNFLLFFQPPTLASRWLCLYPAANRTRNLIVLSCRPRFICDLCPAR